MDATDYLAQHDVEIYLADAVSQLLRFRGTLQTKSDAAAFLAVYFRWVMLLAFMCTAKDTVQLHTRALVFCSVGMHSSGALLVC